MTVDLHHLIAPYALDALEPDERSRFEAHLALCEQCRAELDGFQATAAHLGDAEAATPPPALRERLLAMASTTAQEHPVVTALSQRTRARRLAPRLALAARHERRPGQRTERRGRWAPGRSSSSWPWSARP